MKPSKVAIIHDYLVQYGGAERTLESLLKIFPDADIYTSMYTPNNMSQIIRDHKVIYPKNFFLKYFPKHFTFLLPMVFEGFNLEQYDLVISNGTAWSKSVLTKPEQVHISYIHTPPRFLYGYSVESQKRFIWYYKPFVAIVDHFLRIWDYEVAQRPNYIIANSQEVQKRIKKFYRRDSKVIYPPVDMPLENNPPASQNVTNINKPFYLALGRLSTYKNFDLIINGFNKTHLPLVIAGTGGEEKKLKEMAGNTITFTGKVSEADKTYLYQNCLGFIFPVEEEDCGIVPIEAMSYGKPVLAHRSGGPLETIRDGIDGMFFESINVKEFTNKLETFDRNVKNGIYNADKIKQHTLHFAESRFIDEIKDFIEKI